MEEKSTSQLNEELLQASSLSDYVNGNRAAFTEKDVAELLSALYEKKKLSKAALARKAGMSEVYLHYLFQVPADSDTEDMDFTVTCGGDRRSAQLGLSQFESQLQTVTLGQTITDDETLSLTVDSISFANTLYPPRPASYYHYYEAPSGKTYLIVKMTVTNLKGTDMKYDTIAGVSCVYNGKYNYNSFAAVETDRGGDLSGYPGQNSIAPLDTGVVYYLMEVPAEVEGGPVEVTFYIAGEYYTYSIG